MTTISVLYWGVLTSYLPAVMLSGPRAGDACLQIAGVEISFGGAGIALIDLANCEWKLIPIQHSHLGVLAEHLGSMAAAADPDHDGVTVVIGGRTYRPALLPCFAPDGRETGCLDALVGDWDDVGTCYGASRAPHGWLARICRELGIATPRAAATAARTADSDEVRS